MPETLVINASPLIFLGNAGQLDLLRAGGASRFVVPSSVLDEVTQHADQAARSLAEARWIERAPTVSIPAEITAWGLGPGESAVIATCVHLDGARPVLDSRRQEMCARVRVARHRNRRSGDRGPSPRAHR